jgi:hypothetical protein
MRARAYCQVKQTGFKISKAVACSYGVFCSGQ